jgi:hypothetical protein
MKVIKLIVCNEAMPKAVKDAATQQMNTLTRINKEAMKNSGSDLMDVILASPGSDHLMSSFSAAPEMYANDPECIHRNLDRIFQMQFLQVGVVISMQVAPKNPKKLVPYAKKMVEILGTDPYGGTMCLMALKEMATADPNTMFPLLPEIIRAADTVNGGAGFTCTVVGNCSKATVPADAADQILGLLLGILNKSTDTMYIPGMLNAISNCMHNLSSLELLLKAMPDISKHRDKAEIIVQSIDDYAHG